MPITLLIAPPLIFSPSDGPELLSNQNMANKIKDTHASWQNLFNRNAITPRLESKTKLSNLHTKKYCRIYTYLVIIQMITLKKSKFSSKFMYPKYNKDYIYSGSFN